MFVVAGLTTDPLPLEFCAIAGTAIVSIATSRATTRLILRIWLILAPGGRRINETQLFPP